MLIEPLITGFCSFTVHASPLSIAGQSLRLQLRQILFSGAIRAMLDASTTYLPSDPLSRLNDSAYRKTWSAVGATSELSRGRYIEQALLSSILFQYTVDDLLK